MDKCDKCGKRAELFYNEATGLSYCETCDTAADEADAAECFGENDRRPCLLTRAEADLIHAMLSQRIYLREDDPERQRVVQARDAVYLLTTAYAEVEMALDALGVPKGFELRP